MADYEDDFEPDEATFAKPARPSSAFGSAGLAAVKASPVPVIPSSSRPTLDRKPTFDRKVSTTPRSTTSSLSSGLPRPSSSSSSGLSLSNLSLSSGGLSATGPASSSSSKCASCSSKEVEIKTLTDKLSMMTVLEGQLAEKDKELKQARVRGRRAAAETTEIKTDSSTPSVGPSRDFGNVREIPFNSVKVGEEIAGGGFCTLYKGEWMGVPVAVKRIYDPVITPELREEFENEVAMLNNLRHPNVVSLVGACGKAPTLCIVTEFMNRGSLFHALHMSELDMTKERKLAFSKQACIAMLFLHSCDIVHRDIKSLNFLVSDHLSIMICDFGLARHTSALVGLSGPPMSARSSTQSTAKAPAGGQVQQKQMIAGTPPYMAPELFGSGGPSKASDVYAMGMLLWEIWEKEVPFDGLDPVDIKNKVLAGARPTITKQCPAQLKAVIQNCWSADIGTRPTMQVVVNTLNELRV